SLSPLIHNTAFELLGMDYVYLAFDVQPDYLTEALQGLVALGIAGVNVTLPHKESVIPLLDDLSSEARAIGAVNTIVNDGGKLLGHNTDVYGFVEMMKSSSESIEGEEVSVLGAGGAARAVIYGLMTHFRPKVIHLLNRSVERATSLREFLASSVGFHQIDIVDLYMPAAQVALSKSKLIVNATPLGMSPKTDDTAI
ncbi:MAG: shikimate dehydrogenase, partial [Bacteroidota bacterium]